MATIPLLRDLVELYGAEATHRAAWAALGFPPGLISAHTEVAQVHDWFIRHKEN